MWGAQYIFNGNVRSPSLVRASHTRQVTWLGIHLALDNPLGSNRGQSVQIYCISKVSLSNALLNQQSFIRDMKKDTRAMAVYYYVYSMS